MYLPSSCIHVSDQSVTISLAEILMTFFLMNPMPPDLAAEVLDLRDQKENVLLNVMYLKKFTCQWERSS